MPDAFGGSVLSEVATLVEFAIFWAALVLTCRVFPESM
jgi:hypothetical protein